MVSSGNALLDEIMKKRLNPAKDRAPEISKTKPPSSTSGGIDVQAILRRRQAIELSDSESESDGSDWSDD